MKVSIVLNSYNYGRFLADAIESGLSQTYADTEVVVVDDGSTDNSRDIIRRYGDRIGAVLKPNGGQASAVNAGFANCRGDVVLFLDSDDMLLPETAARVVEVFRDKPETARVQYRLAITDAQGQPTGSLIPANYVPMLSGDLRAAMMKFNNPTWWPPTSGHAFAASTLRRILPMPEAPFRAAMDYYLTRASTMCGPVVSLDQVGAYYRIHGSNIDGRESLDLDQVRTQIELIDQSHPYLKQFAESQQFNGFAADAADVLDIRYLALRLVSLKLAPARHPLQTDGLTALLCRGLRVTREHRHLSIRYRCLAAAWFMAMSLAPRRLAWSLGEQYFYPQTRRIFRGTN